MAKRPKVQAKQKVPQISLIKGTLNNSKFVVAAFVSPEKEQRDWVKSQFEKDGIPFYEVFIEASLETCQTRDVKGDIYVPK